MEAAKAIREVCTLERCMSETSAQFENKKKYEPPSVTAISLRPEEAVLGHCKILGQSGGNTSSVCGFVCPSAGS